MPSFSRAIRSMYAVSFVSLAISPRRESMARRFSFNCSLFARPVPVEIVNPLPAEKKYEYGHDEYNGKYPCGYSSFFHSFHLQGR